MYVAVASPCSGAGVLDDVVPLEYPSCAFIPQALVDARVLGEPAVGTPVCCRGGCGGTTVRKTELYLRVVNHLFFITLLSPYEPTNILLTCSSLLTLLCVFFLKCPSSRLINLSFSQELFIYFFTHAGYQKIYT